MDLESPHSAAFAGVRAVHAHVTREHTRHTGTQTQAQMPMPVHPAHRHTRSCKQVGRTALS